VPAPLLPSWVHECVAGAREEPSVEDRLAVVERVQAEMIEAAARCKRRALIDYHVLALRDLRRRR
jgi:hypothetical protein